MGSGVISHHPRWVKSWVIEPGDSAAPLVGLPERTETKLDQRIGRQATFCYTVSRPLSSAYRLSRKEPIPVMPLRTMTRESVA